MFQSVPHVIISQDPTVTIFPFPLLCEVSITNIIYTGVDHLWSGAKISQAHVVKPLLQAEFHIIPFSLFVGRVCRAEHKLGVSSVVNGVVTVITLFLRLMSYV